MCTDKARAEQAKEVPNDVARSNTTRRPRNKDTALLFCARCGEAMNAEIGPEFCPRCGFRQCVGCGDI